MNGNIMCLVEDTETLGKTEMEAAKLSRLTGLRLILLYVMERWFDASLVTTDSEGWKTVYENWMSDGRALLDMKEDLIRAEGPLPIKKELRGGEKACEMISAAVEQNVHLIVMPRYRVWSIRGIISSSLTNKLIEYSPCPILWVNE